jgi:hypothetical protein
MSAARASSAALDRGPDELEVGDDQRRGALGLGEDDRMDGVHGHDCRDGRQHRVGQAGDNAGAHGVMDGHAGQRGRIRGSRGGHECDATPDRRARHQGKPTVQRPCSPQRARTFSGRDRRSAADGLAAGEK